MVGSFFFKCKNPEISDKKVNGDRNAKKQVFVKALLGSICCASAAVISPMMQYLWNRLGNSTNEIQFFYENLTNLRGSPASGPLRGTVGREFFLMSPIRSRGAPSGAAAFIAIGSIEVSALPSYLGYPIFMIPE